MFYAINAAPINGWQTQYATGAAALALSEAANGQVAIQTPGTATLALAETGNGVIGVQDTGAAPLALAAGGMTSPTVQESGSLQMLFAAKWDLSNPLVHPATYSATHAHRMMLATEERRKMVVPPELIRPAQSELRTMRVSAQKRA